MRKYYGRYSDFIPPTIENNMQLDEEMLYFEDMEEYQPDRIEKGWQQLCLLLCEGIRREKDNPSTVRLGQELLRWSIKKDVYAVSVILQTHSIYFNEHFMPDDQDDALLWLLERLQFQEDPI